MDDARYVNLPLLQACKMVSISTVTLREYPDTARELNNSCETIGFRRYGSA